MPTAKTPLIVDCDPGIDDAVALAFAVGSPEVDLRAVTTVAGNVPVERTTGNALRLLQAFGRDDVPVAAGAARGLVRAKPDHRLVHGENGLGGVELPAAARSPQAEHAVELQARVLRDAAPRSVTIAAIGPLTNIALVIAVHPELTDRVDRLVVMGGSAGRGNTTPVAEYNIWADPEAAHRVLAGSGLDICLVELGVTRRSTVDEAALAQLRAESARGALLADMVLGYVDHAPHGWPLHDVVALAAVVDPTIVRARPTTVEVDTGFGIGRAQTIFTLDGPDVNRAAATTRTRVAVDLDVARFRELLFERVAGRA